MTAIGLKETRLLALKIATRTPYSDSAYVEPSIDTKAVTAGKNPLTPSGFPLYRDT